MDVRCSIRGGADTRPDRARHTGAAKPAIAHRVLGEILLVVVLGEVEWRRIDNLRGDRSEALAGQRLAVHRLGFLGGHPLRRRRGVDAGTVLSAYVVALAHAL